MVRPTENRPVGSSGRSASRSNVRAGARLLVLGLVWLAAGSSIGAASTARAQGSYRDVIAAVQPKMVKIYGAGGVKGLEAYQSGFLISPDGHVLTTWSYVLDTAEDTVTVVLNDGRRFEATLVGADPRLEVAVLKCEATELPHFNLDQPAALTAGDRVLAFSNLFNVAAGDEQASVLHGQVSAKTTLTARRGAYETTYNGSVYVLDAMTNNPGAAGGALVDRRGRIAGLLGKELKNSLNNTWLNYALPIGELAAAVDDILAGKARPRSASEDAAAKKPKEPVTLALLGATLVPDVLAKTPPYIDRVAADSAAAKAGLKADDLVLYVNDRAVSSRKVLLEELTFIDRLDEVRLVVQRGQELLEFTLVAPEQP